MLYEVITRIQLVDLIQHEQRIGCPCPFHGLDDALVTIWKFNPDPNYKKEKQRKEQNIS